MKFFDGVSEIPWGIFAFLFIVVVGGLGVWLDWKDLTLSTYITSVSAGAGLLGVGHGIRTRARSEQRVEEESDRRKRKEAAAQRS
jgi:hypothetical protein